MVGRSFSPTSALDIVQFYPTTLRLRTTRHRITACIRRSGSGPTTRRPGVVWALVLVEQRQEEQPNDERDRDDQGE